jgi:hypothetical protein
MPENVTASHRHKAWIVKFEEQTTPKLLKSLHRAARSQVRRFAGSGAHASHADAEDLVSSVILDTLEGRLTWDPERESLETNLLDAIRFRARDRYEREPPQLHEPLTDDLDRKIADSASTHATLVAPPVLGDDDATQRIAKADEVIEWLRGQAINMPEVLHLLDLFAHGITQRDEVMRTGRMDATTYHNARRRLARIARRTPAGLRAAALGMPDSRPDASVALKLAS